MARHRQPCSPHPHPSFPTWSFIFLFWFFSSWAFHCLLVRLASMPCSEGQNGVSDGSGFDTACAVFQLRDRGGVTFLSVLPLLPRRSGQNTVTLKSRWEHEKYTKYHGTSARGGPKADTPACYPSGSTHINTLPASLLERHTVVLGGTWPAHAASGSPAGKGLGNDRNAAGAGA